MDRSKMFTELFTAMKAAYPLRKPAECQRLAVTFWNENKNKEDFEDLLKSKLLDLQNIKKRSSMSLLNFWTQVSSYATL